MIAASHRHSQDRDSGVNHAVRAACLSAFVMIVILMTPTLNSLIWDYEANAEQAEYTYTDERIAASQ